MLRKSGSRRLATPRGRRAFTILELTISVAIMMAGLLAIQSLMIRQSKQVSRLERWCQPNPTYYVVHQSDRWMRALGAPAGLESQAGQAAWTPPVAAPFSYHVTLLSFARPYDNGQMSANVSMELLH
jgi:hypothetical protein